MAGDFPAGTEEQMGNFWNKLVDYFTKRNTFKVVVVELIILGLLLCVLLAMRVDVDVQLKGDAIMTIEAGKGFNDPGATATADGKTLEVKVTTDLNTAVPGEYIVYYKANYLLSSGQACRKVIVVAP